MEFTSCLFLDVYEGIVEGITIEWTPKAKARLPENARNFEKDLADMKTVTEHVAHASAKRLEKHTGPSSGHVWGGIYH